MIRAGTVLVVNWLLCAAIVLLTDNDHPWLWFAVLDTMAVIVVTIRPAAKAQAMIGGVFVAQIICHAIYGINVLRGTDSDPQRYLDMLDSLAALNLVLFGGWVGGAWRGLAVLGFLTALAFAKVIQLLLRRIWRAWNDGSEDQHTLGP